MRPVLNVYDIEITEHRGNTGMKARTARGRAYLNDINWQWPGVITNLTATVQQILAAGLTVTMPK